MDLLWFSFCSEILSSSLVIIIPPVVSLLVVIRFLLCFFWLISHAQQSRRGVDCLPAFELAAAAREAVYGLASLLADLFLGIAEGFSDVPLRIID